MSIALIGSYESLCIKETIPRFVSQGGYERFPMERGREEKKYEVLLHLYLNKLEDVINRIKHILQEEFTT